MSCSARRVGVLALIMQNQTSREKIPTRSFGGFVHLRSSFVVSLCLLNSTGMSLAEEGTIAGKYPPLDQVMQRIDEALERLEKEGNCPGTRIAASCGNFICDTDRGESELTCPADCALFPVRSYNSQTLCKEVAKVVKPSTLAEVQDAVRAARAAGQPVRVIGRLHSTNSQLCTSGVVISTEKLNRIIGLGQFDGKETVLVEGGASVYGVGEWLHERKKSLGMVMTGYRGVTVAGSAATGAHGSSPHEPSVVSAAVEWLQVVGADGNLREFWRGNTDESTWRAFRANLGMLGVVVQARLRVEPQFNLRVQVSFENDDRLLEWNGAYNMIEDCDFGSLKWFPDSGQVAKICGKRTDQDVEPGATNTWLEPDFPKFAVAPFKAALQYGTCNNWLFCLVNRAQSYFLKLRPPFKKIVGEKLVNSDDVTGYSHLMQSSLTKEDQDQVFLTDWELAVPASRSREALEIVMDVLERERPCQEVLGGLSLRFTPADDSTLLAHSAVGGDFLPGEPVMFLEFPVYMPVIFSEEQRERYYAPYKEIAQRLIREVGARAHWGKNFDWLFAYQCDFDVYGPNLAEFRRVVREQDPNGMFANAWSSYVGISSR